MLWLFFTNMVCLPLGHQWGITSITTMSSNWNIFRVTGPLWGESNGHRWFPSQWPVTRALMFSLIWAWTKGWANNRDAADLRRHHAHYDVTVVMLSHTVVFRFSWTAIEFRARMGNNARTPMKTMRCDHPCPRIQCWFRWSPFLNEALTHWGRNKMAANSLTTVSNAFSWMKIYELWLRFLKFISN